jgi:hypothetical protein
MQQLISLYSQQAGRRKSLNSLSDNNHFRSQNIKFFIENVSSQIIHIIGNSSASDPKNTRLIFNMPHLTDLPIFGSFKSSTLFFHN